MLFKRSTFRSACTGVIFATPFFQRAVQRIIGGPRLETVRFSDGQLFDCFTSEKYYWLREFYEYDEREELESCLTPESVLFDVGAHVGFWEIVLAARCGHIHAFEPSPQNLLRLTSNINQNHLANVTIVPKAVSEYSGALYIAENGSMSQISPAGLSVDAITLDQYVSRHGTPDIVKLDIEGYAGAALHGMRATLASRKPILFIEVHGAEELASCHAVLEEFGYVAAVLNKPRYPYRIKFTIS